MREHIYNVILNDVTEIYTNEQSMKKIMSADIRHNPLVLIPQFLNRDFIKFKPYDNIIINVNYIATIVDYEENAEIVKGDTEND